MPLYDSVANPATGAIRGAEWELHVKEHRPVGTCQDCGAELYGDRREVYYGTTYRDTRCRNGHERTIPGTVYKGTILERVDTLPLAMNHLRAVPDD